MNLRQETISILTKVGMTSILLVPGLAMSDEDETYEVTITILILGQAFTSPLLSTHSKKTGIFTIGEAASSEVQAIAENGDKCPS